MCSAGAWYVGSGHSPHVCCRRLVQASAGVPWPGAGSSLESAQVCFLSQLPSEGCGGLPLGKGWEHSRCPAVLGAQSGFPLQQQAGPAPEPGGSVLTPPLRPCREESGLSLCSSPSDAQELCKLKQPKGREAAVCTRREITWCQPAATPLCHVVPLLDASSGVCCGPVT